MERIAIDILAPLQCREEKEDDPSEQPANLPEKSALIEEDEEDIKHIHQDLLPPGCLSPLPCIPPRPSL